MEKTLIKKNEELIKFNKEMEFMKEATIYLRDQLK